MKQKQQHVYVLGGYGFLGTHVSDLLEKKKISHVRESRRTGTDARSFENLYFSLKKQNPTTIINCAAHVGSVHYAMQNAAEMIHDNLQIITTLYRAAYAANPKIKIINPISNCSYPGEANTHIEQHWEDGPVHDSVLAYASTRRMIYAISKCYSQQYNVSSVNWLIANAYGPGDYLDPNRVHALNGIIIRLLQSKKAKKKTFEIWGSGKPTREWVYIEDVAKLLVESLERTTQITPVNFAQNKAYSIGEIAEIVAKILSYRVEFSFNTTFADGAPFKILDDTEFKKKHGPFRFTPIQTGIRTTIDYYQKHL